MLYRVRVRGRYACSWYAVSARDSAEARATVIGPVPAGRRRSVRIDCDRMNGPFVFNTTRVTSGRDPWEFWRRAPALEGSSAPAAPETEVPRRTQLAMMKFSETVWEFQVPSGTGEVLRPRATDRALHWVVVEAADLREAEREGRRFLQEGRDAAAQELDMWRCTWRSVLRIEHGPCSCSGADGHDPWPSWDVSLPEGPAVPPPRPASVAPVRGRRRPPRANPSFRQRNYDAWLRGEPTFAVPAGSCEHHPDCTVRVITSGTGRCLECAGSGCIEAVEGHYFGVPSGSFPFVDYPPPPPYRDPTPPGSTSAGPVGRADGPSFKQRSREARRRQQTHFQVPAGTCPRHPACTLRYANGHAGTCAECRTQRFANWAASRAAEDGAG